MWNRAFATCTFTRLFVGGGAMESPCGVAGMTLSGRCWRYAEAEPGALKLDDAPFQADHRRVRPVVGVQLRQNALDTSLDGVLSNAELIRNAFVSVPCRDETQDNDFRRCQGV